MPHEEAYEAEVMTGWYKIDFLTNFVCLPVKFDVIRIHRLSAKLSQVPIVSWGTSSNITAIAPVATCPSTFSHDSNSIDQKGILDPAIKHVENTRLESAAKAIDSNLRSPSAYSRLLI